MHPKALSLVVLVLLATVAAVAFASVAFAGDGGGRAREVTVVVDGARYTCSPEGSDGGGAGERCRDARQLLTTVMDACLKLYQPDSCRQKHWPRFVEENPRCVAGALDLCIRPCRTVFDEATCVRQCTGIAP